jgi:hypothetical protein
MSFVWGCVSELSGGHDLFVSNPRDVLQQIEAFVSSLQGETLTAGTDSRAVAALPT